MAAVHALQAMAEHRPVDFVEDVITDTDLQGVRADAEDVAIERGMVDLAQGDAIGDFRLAAARVLDDVGGIEQGGVLERTHPTSRPVGLETIWRNRAWWTRYLTSRIW